MELLAASGAEDPAATLRPLLTAALDNALAHGDAALTGPIVRGDVNTVAAHLNDIAEHAPATIPSYVAMAKATADRAVLDGRLLPIRAAQARPPARRGPGARRAPAVGREPAVAGRPRDATLQRSRTPAHELGRRARARPPARRRASALVPDHGRPARRPRRADATAPAGGRPEAPVVVSIFVNPMQFGARRGPRPLPPHLRAPTSRSAPRQGVDVVFAPSVDEVYPGGDPQVTVDPGRWPRCSRARPGRRTSTAC